MQVPAASFEAKPSASGTTAITAEPAAAPAAPPAPAKTSASVASYAGSNRKPPYPRLSLRNEEQGTVVLRVLVKADGTAGAVELKKSSGYPLLDESARRTVPRWRFNPATVD
ncbi:MAG: energy transducer TonB, partial [Noviherbaspirillum sp.]